MSIHEARPERISSAAVESHGAAVAAAAHSAFHAEAYSFGRSGSQSDRKALASNDKQPEPPYVPAPGEIVHQGTYKRKDGTLEPVLIIEQPHEFK